LFSPRSHRIHHYRILAAGPHQLKIQMQSIHPFASSYSLISLYMNIWSTTTTVTTWGPPVYLLQPRSSTHTYGSAPATYTKLPFEKGVHTTCPRIFPASRMHLSLIASSSSPFQLKCDTLFNWRNVHCLYMSDHNQLRLAARI
jgi:hypothetical protein